MNAPAQLYPWHSQLWQQHLGPVVTRGQLAHALLLTGPTGVGKRRLAFVLTRALLCSQPQPDGRPCGQCHSCKQLATGVHPDYTLLQPDEGKRTIRVEQVRAFRQALFLTAQGKKGRVGVITLAELLNVNAANSLLKVLEEPPANSHIILVSERPGSLIATICSRCQRLTIPVPDAQATRSWLMQQPDAVAHAMPLARGAPLRAATLAELDIATAQQRWFDDLLALLQRRDSPVSLAQRWHQEPLPELLNWLHDCLADLLKLAAGTDMQQCINRGCASSLQSVAEYTENNRIRRLVPEVIRARRLLESNAEKQLLLEQLLIAIRRCRRRQHAEQTS